MELSQQSCLLTRDKMQKICRICLGDVQDDYFWLESFYLEKKVIEIYKNVISIEMVTDDILPKKICSACYNSLVKFYNFKTKVQDSETVLQNSWLRIQKDSDKKNLEENDEDGHYTDNSDSFNDTDPLQDVSETGDHRESDHEVVLCDRIKKESDQCQFDKDIDKMNETQSLHVNKKMDEDIQSVQGNIDVDIKKENKVKQKCKRKNHFKDEHKEKLIKKSIKQKRKRDACKECGKVLLAYLMKNHLRTHTKEKPFSCDKCQACFAEKSNLSRHMKIHGDIKPHKCQICGKGFLRPSSLAIHEAIHTTEKSFMCSMCGKGFKLNMFLTKHISNVHTKMGKHKEDDKKIISTGPKVACPTCGKLFKSRYSLAVHETKHDATKAFLCNICGNSYSSKVILENHQRLHTGEKFGCDICKKKFTLLSTLRTHVLMHRGEKPLSCRFCNKKFRQHSHLNIHIRGQHLNERPFKCKFCDKAFAHNGNLTVHTRIHTGETPYHCDICQKGFHDSSSMKKHRKCHLTVNEKIINANVNVDSIDDNNAHKW